MFLDGMHQVLDAIARGDVYQANLSRSWRTCLAPGATADATEIVATEVHQHDVLGAFFFVELEFALERRVGDIVPPARARAGDGAGARDTVLQLQQAFR